MEIHKSTKNTSLLHPPYRDQRQPPRSTTTTTTTTPNPRGQHPLDNTPCTTCPREHRIDTLYEMYILFSMAFGDSKESLAKTSSRDLPGPAPASPVSSSVEPMLIGTQIWIGSKPILQTSTCLSHAKPFKKCTFSAILRSISTSHPILSNSFFSVRMKCQHLEPALLDVDVRMSTKGTLDKA